MLCKACMTKMTFAAYGWAAHIHAHMAGSDGVNASFWRV